MGAGDEFPHNASLLELAGNGPLAVVAGTRPAEFRDDNALAFEFLTQILVYIYGRLDRVLGRYTTPVGQYVRGNKIQGRDQPFRRESALLGRLRVGCAAGQSLKQIRLVAWLGLSRF